ncbi:MAG: hypothetical protein ACLUD0_05080 [Eubacterium ramulus]
MQRAGMMWLRNQYDPEDSVSGAKCQFRLPGADDTGKMVRGKGTTKNGSAPVAVFVIVVVACSGWYYGRCENLQKRK